MKLPSTFDQLVQESESLKLYKKLVIQLNKDFLYANIDLDFEEDITPQTLKVVLHETVHRLIQEKFAEYLNLLYIIDVSEEKIKQLYGDDTLKLSEQVSFLILRREWQKVWFKAKYSS